jgi:ATP-binding cassette subfamily B protein
MKQFFILLFLMIAASFAEILSLSSIIPFLNALTFPEKIFSSPGAQPLISFLKIQSPSEIIFPLTIVFYLSAILFGVVRLVLLIFTNRFSFETGSDLGIDIYERTLYQPYKIHLSRNSVEIFNGISNKANAIVCSVIILVITVVSSSKMLLGILLTLNLCRYIHSLSYNSYF